MKVLSVVLHTNLLAYLSFHLTSRNHLSSYQFKTPVPLWPSPNTIARIVGPSSCGQFSLKNKHTKLVGWSKIFVSRGGGRETCQQFVLAYLLYVTLLAF